MSDTGLSLSNRLARLRRAALVAGCIGLALAAGSEWLALSERGQFFRSYLVAFLAALSPAVGALALLLIHRLTGGEWGATLRPVLEPAARTLPLLAVLFVPLLFGLPAVYPWARWTAEDVAGSAVLHHKSLYLNAPGFVARSALYLAIWAGLSWLVGRDERDALARRVSGPGLLLLGLSVTFAAVDWVMSIEPFWYSSIFGLLFGAGQLLAALAFGVLCLVLLVPEVRRGTLQDLGSLLLALVMIWAYMGFSQFLLIWSANLPEEVPWYLKRLDGGWRVLALMLVGVQFVLPFLLLLSRDLKRRPGLIGGVAAVVLFMRVVDLYWMVTPAYFPYQGFRLHLLDAALLVGVGGVWLAGYALALERRLMHAVGEAART